MWEYRSNTYTDRKNTNALKKDLKWEIIGRLSGKQASIQKQINRLRR